MKRRKFEDDPYSDIDLSFDIGKGDCIQLTDHPYKPIKKRPIGFLANIDVLEDHHNYGQVFKSPKGSSKRKSV